MRPFLALLIFVLAGAVRAAEPDPALAHAEEILRQNKIETTGPALLQFFRERTLTEADVRRLSDAVKRLGDEDFDTREKAVEELVRAHRKALPFLRAARADKDAERSRRVADCIAQIESGSEVEKVAAAVRVLAHRRPEGAAAVLLAYLPGAEDETLEAELFRALAEVAAKDGKTDPTLVTALTDRRMLCRAAAVHVLGRLNDQRPAVRRLLADVEPRVRFEAALALLTAGDKEAVPVLITLLGEGPMPLAWRAQELLYRLAGEKAPIAALTDETAEKRAAVAANWHDWWKNAGPKIDLAKINLDDALQGLNIVCEFPVNGLGRVWACHADRKPIWEIKGTGGAIDAQLLPNGRVLIAENEARKVTERDLTGKVLWSFSTEDFPTSCRRLPNGNTFIATQSEVMEVDREGKKKVFSRKSPAPGYVARVHRLPNGHMLLATQDGQLVELDAAGRPLRSIKIPGPAAGWASVEALPGDRFLVSIRESNRVVEFDGKGTLIAETKVQSPMSAVKLPNGNVLVSCWDTHRVIEIDRTNKEVWKIDLPACGGRVLRY